PLPPQTEPNDVSQLRWNRRGEIKVSIRGHREDVGHPLTDREAGGKPVRRRRAPAPARFVELAPLPTTAAECVIELEGPRGKLRIQWKGATAPDLAGLSRVLWESA
ncbi:MAG: hypothetical protein ABR880_24455, partial [Candidatus Sulfotelmatobacter sp.]